MRLSRTAMLSAVFGFGVLLVVLLVAAPTGIGSSLFGGNGDSDDTQTDAAAAVDAVAPDGDTPLTLPSGEAVAEAEPAGPEAFGLTEAEWDAAYAEQLDLILASSVRNTNHDASPFQQVPSDRLDLENHLGPRSEYLGDPGGNTETSFPTDTGGQFRAGCEFSHFAYDDPLVLPGQPGAAHLHMFFGNTHVNAFSTYETLIDSGSSTCNGQELNRTGYWVPAMFDGEGNVRVPERVVVYYKGEGKSRGAAVPYPPGAALIATEDINTLDVFTGGAEGKFSFTCSDQWSSPGEPASNTIPDCDGSRFFNEYGVTDEPHVVLEMNVKFPQCWNGQDPSDWEANFATPSVGGWYASDCGGEFGINLPNLEYFVNYRVDIGESTADWYLSSDVDPATFTTTDAGGSSVHGDWWGGWNAEVADLWIANCVNFQAEPLSGCGFGYLTDGGPDPDNPLDGPALRYRPQYTGPEKIDAAVIFEQLCAPFTDRTYAKPADAAYCVPG